MQVERCTYFVPVNQVKSNGEKLNSNDLISLGYLAGRCGVNLDGNPREVNNPNFENEGVKLNINCCTCDLFEDKLQEAGIKFDVLA